MKDESTNGSMSYLEMRDYDIRLEAKFGEQAEIRWAKMWEWHHLSKRNPLDPYEITGATGVASMEFQDTGPYVINMVKMNKCLDFGSSEVEGERKWISPYCHEYYTLDNDPDAKTDFSDLSAIPDDMKFDGVIAMEVFEHIHRDDIANVIAGISHVMEKNGIIVASMPNILNPVYFYKNYDHKNPMRFNHLGSMFSFFNIEVIETYLFEFRQSRWERLRKQYNTPGQQELFNFRYDVFGMHPANHVAIVGMKRDSTDYNY